MNIAIVGCGSLIWSPRELQLEGHWHGGGPVPPIEFSGICGDRRLPARPPKANSPIVSE